MTWFANAPVPTNSLSVPNPGITRRPSKLSPSERLSRPPQLPTSSTQHGNQINQGNRNNATNAPGGHMGAPIPSSARPPSSSPHRRAESALPPLPDQNPTPAPLPGSLLPGGARPTKQGAPLSLQQVLSDPYIAPSPTLPSNLRPGPGRNGSRITSGNTIPPANGYVSPGTSPGTSPISATYVQPHASPVYAYPPAHTPSPAPVPLLHTPSLGHPPSFSTPPPPPVAIPYRPNTSLPPPMWIADNQPSVLSFPVAMGAAPPVAPQTYTSSELPFIPQSHTPSLPDPHLHARYQTPLPLPPKPSSPPCAAPRPPQQGNLRIEQDRIEALRLAEEDAARRKEQADKDLELALQLDRELNLGV
jgi:hypothetical protein